MHQESEIVDLVLAVVLTPVILIGLRSVHIAGKRSFVASYTFIMCAFVFTVIEGYTAPVLFNALEHIAYAFAGIFMALAMLSGVREMRRRLDST